MVARGDFGHHSAELGVDRGLAENLMREYFVEPPQNRGGRFVARGLDSEERGLGYHFFAWGVPFALRIMAWSASTARSSWGSAGGVAGALASSPFLRERRRVVS